MKRLKTGRRKAAAKKKDGDTERRILDAAHTVFVRRGTAGARMQEIAAEAGVNQALLHYYFRNKEQLALAAFERAGKGFMPAVIDVLASGGGLEDKVRRIVQLEIEHLARAPYLPGYIIGEVTHRPERAAQLIGAVTGLTPRDLGPRILGALKRQIGERVKAGAMRPIAPESFIVNLMALCIFPFAVRPMVQAMLGFDDRQFERFMTRRIDDLPAFFLGALRP
jgi:TetR/AcrR family transcriptional regulator